MESSTIPLPPQNPSLLKQIIVRPILPGERQRWDALMRRHHYLGFAGMVGESLRYVAEGGGQWVALLGWQAAALKCRPRDRWIGWPPVLHYQRLPLIANNGRFLILPEVKLPNLASRVLSLNLKRLCADWQAVHGHPLLLAETFVDPARFTAACYRAANWRLLGRTRGYAKHHRTYAHHKRPKWVLVYPLHRRAQQRLADPHMTTGSPPTMNPKTLTAKQLDALHQQIGQLPDGRKRRGIRHRYRTVLTLALAAVVCGARSFAALGEFAAMLTQAQLKHLGARVDQHTKRHQPPSESTLRRVLQASDAEALDRVLGQWLLAQSNPSDPLAVDGKTLRGARRHDGSKGPLLSAFLHQQGGTAAQIEVGENTNEIPEIKRLLTPLDIEGRVVTADAMHTQQETARYLVEEKKAHSRFTVKDNQQTLREDIVALSTDDFSPGAHPVRASAWPPGNQNDPGFLRPQRPSQFPLLRPGLPADP